MVIDFLNRLIEIAKPRAQDLGELASQLELLLKHLHSTFPGNRVGIYILNESQDTAYRLAYFDGEIFNNCDSVAFEKDKYPELLELLLNHQDFFIHDINDFPIFSSGLRQLEEEQAFPRAFLVVPFRIEGRLSCWIFVNNPQESHSWDSEQIQACKLFARVLGRGILEKHFKEVLQRTIDNHQA